MTMTSAQQQQHHLHHQQLLPKRLDPKPSDDALKALLDQYPPASTTPVTYGTAGFRYHANVLPPVMVRVGITAALRSMQLGAPVGVMVTASHNDETYNGVKIADPDGGMMTADGEALAVQLANEHSTETTLQIIQKLRNEYNSSSSSSSSSTNSPFIPTLHVGCDTRDHSVPLLNLVLQAAQGMGCQIYHHGIVTTPMLHHAVLHGNRTWLPLQIPPRPAVLGYFDLLTASYHALLETAMDDDGTATGAHTTANHASTKQPLVVDAACGVGYAALLMLHTKLQAWSHHHRPLIAVNAPGDGPLNHQCGSEHVQKALQPPVFYNKTGKSLNTNYCASLDGDADRIVFFSLQQHNDNNGSDNMTLLDGDKIACLLCGFLQQEWSALATAVDFDNNNKPLRLGVVQTAYANGASTAYLKSILSSSSSSGVVIAKTGVKHVHHAAMENFDVGVYFEANGHGTILFGTTFYDYLQQASKQLRGQTNRAVTALQRLSVLPSLVNQAVGDALSDLLLVDAILQLSNKNLQDWDAIYKDLPSRQCKVRVKDRTIIKTNDNETKCLEPATVQIALEAAMQEYGGRAFIRPSGTEDVVRVYAEAETRENADALARRAAEIVHELCQGMGELPVFPSSKM